MTDIEICNMALTRLGCNPIAQLGEGTNEQRVMKAQYPGARDFVLADREWTFASDLRALAQDAVAPAFIYSKAFIIPSGVLKVVRCYDGPSGEPETLIQDWQRKKARVVTDSAAVYAETIERVPEGEFSPGMVQALVEYLIHVAAVPLTENAAASVAALKGYEAKVMMAASTDAMQGRTRLLVPPRLPGRVR